MSVNATAPSVHGWASVDDLVIAYAEWRTACAAVWTAYRDWADAPKADAAFAHAVYGAALDREAAAANAYSRLVKPAFEPKVALADSDLGAVRRPEPGWGSNEGNLGPFRNAQ